MAESSKRAGDSTVSDEPTHKRAKTSKFTHSADAVNLLIGNTAFEPFSYDSTPDAITAENLARSIPELPSSTQSADLTQATIFYRNERKKFALLYKKWQSVCDTEIHKILQRSQAKYLIGESLHVRRRTFLKG